MSLTSGTLSSWDNLDGVTQLTLSAKHMEILCDDTCTLEGAPGKRVVQVVDIASGITTLGFLTIKDGDRSFGGHGGGLLVSDAAVELIMIDFDGNEADGDGGAIYLSGDSGTISMTGCEFADNVATNGDGDDLYRLSGNFESISACPAGSYGSEGVSLDTAVHSGSALSGKSYSCSRCPAGKSSSTTGATSSGACSSCEGGTFSEVSLDKDKKKCIRAKTKLTNYSTQFVSQGWLKFMYRLRRRQE